MDMFSLMAAMIRMRLRQDDPNDDDLIRFQCEDGTVFRIPFKIFKMWTRAVKLMHHPFRSFQGMVECGFAVEWIIKWCRKHQDDEPDPSNDSPNFGITSIDDIPEWDKQLMSELTDWRLDIVTDHAMDLGVKSLMVLLFKEKFCRCHDLEMIAIHHPNPRTLFDAIPIMVYNPAIRSDLFCLTVDITCEDGSKVVATVKAIKKWRSVSKFIVSPDGDDDYILNPVFVQRRIPKVSSMGMKWIIEWGEKHEDDPDIDDVSGLDNLGITDIDDVSDEDKELIMKMTRNEMKMALRDCSRLNLQPLIIVLLKMMFKRYNLIKVVMKDVRDLSKKITIFNPTIKIDEVD